MTKKFTLDKFKLFWQSNPVLIIDSNGWLDLYRFSPRTTKKVLEIFEIIQLEDHWLPAQVYKEFNNNKEKVKRAEFNKYKSVNKELEKVLLKAKNDISSNIVKFSKFTFPKVNELGEEFISSLDLLQKKAKEYEEKIIGEISENRTMLENDEVNKFIDALKVGHRIGNNYSISELIEIYKEGEIRYKYKIPPGYEDKIEKDKIDPTGRAKYGDLILWKQILNYSSSNHRPVIFITRDEKEDWWVLDQTGNPIEPRYELISEFQEVTQQKIAILNLTDFYKYLSIIFGQEDYLTFLELNADSLCMEILQNKEWQLLIDEDFQLTSYLINSDEFQSHLSNVLKDVELVKAFEPEIEVISFNVNEDKVIIEVSFVSNLHTTYTESFSRDYSVEGSTAYIDIKGLIKFDFKVDFDKHKNDEDAIIEESVKISVSGFEISEVIIEDEYEEYEENAVAGCRNCGSENESYLHSSGESVCESCKVYCWFNVKTLEIFYVGLGTGNRRYQTKKRNNLFKEYYEDNECEVLLLKEGLSEGEGVQLEKDLINEINPCCNMTKGT